MIEVSVHGLPEEINKFSEWLRVHNTQSDIVIRTESRNYPDRLNSQYVRQYWDIIITQPEQLLKVDKSIKNIKEK